MTFSKSRVDIIEEIAQSRAAICGRVFYVIKDKRNNPVVADSLDKIDLKSVLRVCRPK